MVLAWLLAAYWASSLWWLLDAVLQLLQDWRSTLRALASPLRLFGLVHSGWRPTSLLVEMDSPNLGLPCGWAESPLPRCPFFWT